MTPEVALVTIKKIAIPEYFAPSPEIVITLVLDKKQLLKSNKMATKKTFADKIVKEKLAVFTFNDAMQEPSFRRYFIKNWNNLTVGLKKSTILFIGGIHGQETGDVGGYVSFKTLTNQVRIF